jgi:hypothetical protein
MSTKYREQRIKKHASIYRKKRRVGLELASDSRDEVRHARSTAISISDVDIAKVIREATDRHNRKVSSGVNLLNEQWMNPNQDASMLSGQQRAIVTAYLRHSYTNYDATLLPVGSNEKAYETIKRKFNEAIWERYPELSFEKDVIASNIAAPIHVPADFSVDELTAEERRTVLAAIDERIIIENVVLEHLVDDTCFSMNKGSLNKLTPKYSDIPPQGRLATAVVSYALRRHSNLESVLLPYLNRPGFPAAWDLLHASVLEAFALRLPEYAQAFRSIRHLPAHDWQQKKYALAWTSLSGEARSTELLVTRTTIEHMLRTPPSTLTKGYAPTGLMGALETCFQDYTNFNYEIAFLYEADLKENPELRHELTVQVINAIADTYPQLRAVATSRINELTAIIQKEKEAAERAKKERAAEQAEKLSRQEQMATVDGVEPGRSIMGFPVHELIELMKDHTMNDESKMARRSDIAAMVLTQSQSRRSKFIRTVTGVLPSSLKQYYARKELPANLKFQREIEDAVRERQRMVKAFPELEADIKRVFESRAVKIWQRMNKHNSENPDDQITISI